MIADSDYLIIKQKSWDETTHRNDVHTAKSLINQVLLGNVRSMMAGLFQKILVG